MVLLRPAARPPSGPAEADDRHSDRHSDRDRDADGRPASARQRDALGRPLARGIAGYPAEPQQPLTGPDDALERAQAFLDAGRAFAAHEVLEAAWKAAPDDEREMWQGLAQLAVAHTHLQRGNGAGALRLLERATARLRDVADPPPYRIARAGLLATADHAAALLAAGRPPSEAAGQVRWLLRG